MRSWLIQYDYSHRRYITLSPAPHRSVSYNGLLVAIEQIRTAGLPIAVNAIELFNDITCRKCRVKGRACHVSPFACQLEIPPLQRADIAGNFDNRIFPSVQFVKLYARAAPTRQAHKWCRVGWNRL